MFLPSKFYVYREDKQFPELREKKTRLYAGCLTLIAIGFVYAFIASFAPASNCPKSDYHNFVILLSIGIFHIILGVIPLLVTGKLVLDKEKKELYYMGGSRKFFFHPLTVLFSEISHIQIKEYYSGYYGAGLMWDKIILKLKNKTGVKLDYSRNDEYLNTMVRKISECVACDVFCDSY